MKEYIPIDCNLYDFFEEASTLGKVSHILVVKEGLKKVYSGRIIDLFTREKEEFLVLENGLTIRLDHVEELNGIPISKNRNC